MIAENEILDAVNRLLVEHWPDRTVYCNTIPQEFTRESFALLESFYKVEDGGPDCVEITAGYTILGYLPPDKRGNVDRLGLGILLRDMQDLFRCGYLPVSDRALRVTECSGSIEEGAAFLDLQLTFYDDREHPKEKPRMKQVFIRNETE